MKTTNLLEILQSQMEWSADTFGPIERKHGVVDHIRKELLEIEADPSDLMEWIDVIILAMDGAWRTGATPSGICEALLRKQAVNRRREWPDWRGVPDGKAIEHVKPGACDGPTTAEPGYCGCGMLKDHPPYTHESLL